MSDLFQKIEFSRKVEKQIIEFEGVKLELTQLPHIDQRNGINAYFAIARDDDLEEYEIRWEIINADCEDESEACDWEDYKIRKL